MAQLDDILKSIEFLKEAIKRERGRRPYLAAIMHRRLVIVQRMAWAKRCFLARAP